MASSSGVNPVLALVHRADNLANAFTSAHSHSVPIVQSLQALLHIQSSPPEEHVEQHLSAVRDDLDRMETSVGEMMSMLYEVDVFLAQPETVLRAGFNPKEALSHVSELFHMYQAELLSKRELLADLTCEDVGIDDFVRQWSTLSEVNAGKKQEVDDLADLLSSWG